MHVGTRISPVAPRSASKVLIVLLLLLTGIPAAIANETPAGGEADLIEVRGRVLDPQGSPVSGADVLLFRSDEAIGPAVQSAEDGSFSIEFDKSSIAGDSARSDHGKFVSVVAKTSEYAPAWVWVQLGQLEHGAEVVLRLAEDDISVRGRILTLDGRPIAGARLEVTNVSMPLEGTLDGFMDAFRDRPVHNTWVEHRARHMSSITPTALDFGTEKETDEQGRFELQGIGRERLLKCQLSGPDIETTTFFVMTRPQIPPSPPLSREALRQFETPLPIYAATFNHYVGPSRPITGTVKGKDDGAPIAGARLWVYHGSVMHTAETNERGEYSLKGLPVRGEFRVNVVPPEGEPYLPASDSVIVTGALDNLQADLELTRGGLVTGRLVNAQTQQAVHGYIEYLAFPGNPHYSEFSGGHRAETNADGEFELVVAPGPGAVAALGTPSGAFCFAKPEEFDRLADEQGLIATANRGVVETTFFHRVAPINPAEDSEPITLRLALRPAQEVTLNLVDTDGHPVVTGVLGCAQSGYAMHPVQGGTYNVPSLEADEARTVFFLHPERNIGAGLVVFGDEPGTQTVTLRPCATLTGRVVDAQNRPVTDALVFIWIERSPISRTTLRSDVDGRFHLTGVVPGVACRLMCRPRTGGTFELARLSLRSGEQRDLGDMDVSQAKTD